MLFRKNRIGVPSWFLAAQRHVLQAIEVYTGADVLMHELNIKVLKHETREDHPIIDKMRRDLTLDTRKIEVEAVVFCWQLSTFGYDKKIIANFLLSGHRWGQLSWHNFTIPDGIMSMRIQGPSSGLGSGPTPWSAFDVLFAYHEPSRLQPYVQIKPLDDIDYFGEKVSKRIVCGRNRTDRSRAGEEFQSI